MDDAIAQTSILLRDAEVQAQFIDYYYDYSMPVTKSQLVPLTDDKKAATTATVKKEGDQISPSDVHIAA
jgi:hypothetical protein